MQTDDPADRPASITDPGSSGAAIPVVALAGAVVAVVGSCGPWIVQGFGDGPRVSLNGLDSFGPVPLLCALATVAVLLAGRGAQKALAPAFGAVVLLTALTGVVQVLRQDVPAQFEISVGWGTWVLLAGGVLMLAGTARHARGSG